MSNKLVIIPTYNEEDTIIELVNQLFNLNIGLDILIVDDGNDSTQQLIEEKQKENPNLFMIKRKVKSGRGTAVLEGLQFGLTKHYDYFIEMDADLSHLPSELPNLLKEAKPNTVVIGSRYIKGSKIINWPLKRRLFSRFANFYAGLILNVGINDYTDGYRVYSRDAIEKLDFNNFISKGYIILSEIAYQLKKKQVKFTEVKITFINRSRGASSFSFDEIKESFLTIIKIRMK